MTSNLVRRIWEHKTDAVESFTRRCNVHTLVYAEFHETMESVIHREKQIKGWRRAWKLTLIERDNPPWADLTELGVTWATAPLRREAMTGT